MIVVATKLDATTDRTRLEQLREFCAERGVEFHAISSATGEGIKQLVRAMADTLDRLAPAEELPLEEAEIPLTEGEFHEMESQDSDHSSEEPSAAEPAAPRTEER
jgi:50S ribosomal subunit-associated GTPase HflX